MTEENGEVRKLTRGWVAVKLKDLFTPNRPRVSPQKYPDLPFIGMEHISPQTMKLLGTDVARNLKSNAVHFYLHDVLYGRLRPYLNKVYKADFEGLCSSEFIVFPQTEWLSSEYLQYLLNSAKFVSFASHLNEGERPRVDFNAIGDYEFPLPPFNEQNRIVEKIEELFSDLDQGIENLKKAQKQLKVYRQVVLKWAFEGKLTEKWRSQIQQENLDIKTGEELLAQIKTERENRYQQQLAEWEEAVREWEAIGKQGKKLTKPQKPKDLPPITKTELTELPQLPHGWRWVRVGNLTHKVTVGHVGSMKDEYIECGIPFLRSQNVRENRFDPSGLKYISKEFHNILNKSQLKQEDIVIVRSGNVGTACVIPGILEEANCSDLVIIKKPYLANSKLIAYYFNSVTKTRVSDKKVGVALTHFNTQSVEEFAVPFTTFEEQDQIVQEIELRLSICDRLEDTIIENLQKAEALRQSILKQAFEGKLVPQDPNDEPAEKLLERIKQEKTKVKKGEQLSIQGI